MIDEIEKKHNLAIKEQEFHAQYLTVQDVEWLIEQAKEAAMLRMEKEIEREFRNEL